MSDTPEILLDCLGGKLTSFDAIVGYVSQLEMQNAELLEALKFIAAAPNTDSTGAVAMVMRDIARAAIAKAEKS